MTINIIGKQIKIEKSMIIVPVADLEQQIDSSVRALLDVAGTEGQLKVSVTNMVDKNGHRGIVINLPSKNQSREKIREFEWAVKTESFLYQKVMLYLFKQTYPEYEDKELMFVAVWNNYKDPKHEGSEMPDAVFYDTFDETYTTIQYKFAWEATFENYTSGNFAAICNDKIHIMHIGTKDQQDLNIVYEHVRAQPCKFDIVIQSESVSNEFVMAPVDKPTLKNVWDWDEQYMIEEGNKYRNVFYHAYLSKNNSYFRYDQKFVMEFDKFVNSYNTPSQKWVWIDNQKCQEKIDNNFLE